MSLEGRSCAIYNSQHPGVFVYSYYNTTNDFKSHAKQSTRAGDFGNVTLEETFNADDDVNGLTVEEILSRLQTGTTVPSGFTFTLSGQTLFTYSLDIEFDIVKVVAFVALKTDLMIVVSLDGK